MLYDALAGHLRNFKLHLGDWKRFQISIQKKCNVGRILSFESTGLNLRVRQLWIPLLLEEHWVVMAAQAPPWGFYQLPQFTLDQESVDFTNRWLPDDSLWPVQRPHRVVARWKVWIVHWTVPSTRIVLNISLVQVGHISRYHYLEKCTQSKASWRLHTRCRRTCLVFRCHSDLLRHNRPWTRLSRQM